MSLFITKRCINCDLCTKECPNKAIYKGQFTYKINKNLCTECVGYYKKPNCQSVCPIKNTIVKDLSNIENVKSLLKKQKKISSKYKKKY
ncbi:MAG: YfhL family 4Fe-4S dicluster ferredoxin [Arsenophonus sp.]|nr:MAG: YfhL family 4Fe-4S dicluster ferredoxin [Arsenophonus sp.]